MPIWNVCLFERLSLHYQNTDWLICLLLVLILVLIQESFTGTNFSFTSEPATAIQDKIVQKNELPLGSKEREDLVNEIKNQVSTSQVPQLPWMSSSKWVGEPDSRGEHWLLYKKLKQNPSQEKWTRITTSQWIRCVTRTRRHFVVRAKTTPVFLQKSALRPSIFLKQRKGNCDNADDPPP